MNLVVLGVFAVLSLPIFAGFAVIAFVVVRAMRVPDGASVRTVAGEDVALHALVVRPEQTRAILSDTSPEHNGVVSLQGAALVWEPAAGPAWHAPLQAVSVLSVDPALSSGGPGLQVHVDGSGPWRLEVDDRPLHQGMNSTNKGFRRARLAAWFAHQLVARGAHDLRPGAVPVVPVVVPAGVPAPGAGSVTAALHQQRERGRRFRTWMVAGSLGLTAVWGVAYLVALVLR